MANERRMARASRLGIATAIGAILGLAIGMMYQANAIGIILGLSVGAAVGAAWDLWERDRPNDKQ